MIKQLPTSITKWLSNNSSSEDIFNASKYEYETALKNRGYQQTKLIFNKNEHKKQKRNRNQNLVWFNLPFSRNVTTNVVKRFLNLLDIHFPKSNKLHKISNKVTYYNLTVKVSYCCIENLLSIIKTHNNFNEKIAPPFNDQRPFNSAGVWGALSQPPPPSPPHVAGPGQHPDNNNININNIFNFL